MLYMMYAVSFAECEMIDFSINILLPVQLSAYDVHVILDYMMITHIIQDMAHVNARIHLLFNF